MLPMNLLYVAVAVNSNHNMQASDVSKKAEFRRKKAVRLITSGPEPGRAVGPSREWRLNPHSPDSFPRFGM
jgi:hypothetical protein